MNLSPTSGSRAMAMLRGVLSLAVLTGLLAGIPLLLLMVAGSPIPRSVPRLDELQDLLTRRDDGTLFIGAVRLITWAAWASFLISCLLEIFATLRGRPAPHLPGLGGQRLAARLIASITVAVGVLGASAANAAALPQVSPAVSPTAPPSVASSPAGAPQTGQSLTAATPSQQAAVSRPAATASTVLPAAAVPHRYQAKPRKHHLRVVKQGDTLWDIAVDEYGRGERYPTIAKATRHLRQPRGLPRLTNPHLIYPGQRLIIPRAKAPAQDPKPSRHPAPDPSAPRPGNTAKPSPPAPGSTWPTQTPSPTPPQTQAPSPAPSSSEPSPPAAPAPAPSATAPSPTPTSPTPAPSTAAPSPTTPPSTEQQPAAPTPAPAATPQDGAQADSGIPATAIAGYSALAAAGLLSLLALKRLIQQRRRRPGRRIAMPQQMSDTELGIRVHAEPASVQLLDTGLRSLSAQLADTGGMLPSVQGARVTATTVDLLLADPAAPTAPFTAAPTAQEGRPTAWALDQRSDALLDAAAVTDIPAPYPALVTLGHDAERNHVLLDLENAGAITLTGDHDPICEVLAALALELATSPWADHIIVTCIAFAEELPRVLGTGRLRYADTIDEALRDFEACAREVADVLADADVDSVRQARTQQVADETWTPQIILSSVPFGPDEITRLGALVTGAPTGNLAAVVAADGEHAFPGRRLDATPDQTIHLEPFGDLTLQRVTANQFQQLITDLTIANDDHGVEDPAWQNVPDEPALDQLPPPPHPQAETPSPQNSPTPTGSAPDADDVWVAGGRHVAAVVVPPTRPLQDNHAEDDAQKDEIVHLDPNAPEIRVLGRVEIAGRDVDELPAGKRGVITELAAFLYLNPGRSAEEVSRALGGPRGPWAKSTRAVSMSRLRGWFGRDPHGHNYVLAQGEGTLYTLAPSVRCDWDRFQHLAQRGLARLHTGPSELAITDLRVALDLVRGQPFASAGPHNYIWAEHLKQEMISAIVDVAHALAVTLTQDGDPASARTVLATGLDIEPGSELLYRDWFRAEHRAGNISGIDEAAERLMVVLAELSLEMEPETADLLAKLRRHRRTG